MVPRQRTDELPRLRGKQVGNRFSIGALQRFAGEDHRPAIDLVPTQPGFGVSLIDEQLKLVGVDRVVRAIRGQLDGRSPQHLTLHYDEAAGEGISHATKMDEGEHEVRGGGPDIYADRLELD